MTNQERKYLRAIFHHFEEKQIFHTNTPDIKELAAEWRKNKIMIKAMGFILTLGNEDGQSVNLLNELMEENKIEFIK